ncbi:MAG: DEAD/DEAH box helicase, partial [Candidatus Electrothrix sp. AR5]|nr:DEAD/DEAH box helicase [Candidatus Electrothrix sp. AR5]
MIKRFLIKAGRKLKRLASSGEKKKKTTSLPEQEPLHSTESQHTSSGKTVNTVAFPAAGQQRGAKGAAEGAEQNRPAKKPRRKKPRWTLEQFPVAPVVGKSRFHDFSLSLGLMHAIADLDFKYCTPIQEKALPDAMAGKDIIARAGTGTGKSAVFLIAVFARLINENKRHQAAEEKTPLRKPGFPRALIIAPTRELVMQIAKDGQALAKYAPLRVVAVYGGTDYQKQERALTERPV